MKFPAPTDGRQTRLLFFLSPPLFALIGGAASLLYSYATMTSEALSELRAEVFELGLWSGAVCGVGGLLFAWIQLLRFRGAAAVVEDESGRLEAWVEKEGEEGQSPEEEVSDG